MFNLQMYFIMIRTFSSSDVESLNLALSSAFDDSYSASLSSDNRYLIISSVGGVFSSAFCAFLITWCFPHGTAFAFTSVTPYDVRCSVYFK